MKNIDKIKVELNIMNSLIGSKNIESDFELLFKKYPQIGKCLPLLIAVREKEIKVIDDGKKLKYNFTNIDDIVLAEGKTIDEIKDSVIIRKIKPELPKVVKNILICKNPRCITSIEKDLDQIFILTDRENKVYRCKYCESSMK